MVPFFSNFCVADTNLPGLTRPPDVSLLMHIEQHVDGTRSLGNFNRKPLWRACKWNIQYYFCYDMGFGD